MSAAIAPVTEERRATAEFGMWIFLATELMFFAPLFLGYAYGRDEFAEGFAEASRRTDIVIGTLNTMLLLTSSLFMALAVRAAQLGQRGTTRTLLLITATLGLAFLALKGWEYRDEYREHLVPWLDFADSSGHGARYFFWLYFAMTGLHALHLSVGVALVLWLAHRVMDPHADAPRLRVQMTGLYWHLVDAIWVVLYPMIYLVSRHP